MEADVLGVRPASRRPAASAVLPLVGLHPLLEQAPRVREDAVLDVVEQRGRRAASRQDREAAQADVLDRAVGVLDLHVAGEDIVAENEWKRQHLTEASGIRSNNIKRYDGSKCPEPLCDQAAVEAEAAEWAKWWKVGEKYELHWPQDDATLPPIMAEDVIAAARTFPADTGLGADGISQRALLRLSEEAIDALAHLYNQIENAGSWTNSLDLVLIVLLGKADGGTVGVVLGTRDGSTVGLLPKTNPRIPSFFWLDDG